jgi:hypothetical protein
MNDLQKELQELKAKVAELESRIVAEPRAKWQPEGGNWWIDEGGEVVEGHTSRLSIEFGSERQTKEQAERASVEMRRFNRLLALRDELCGNAVVNWTDNESNKWILYFDNKDNEWTTGKYQYMQYIGVYFANEASAQKACDMLNSGEVEL